MARKTGKKIDAQRCPNCKGADWKDVRGIYFEMNDKVKAAVSVGTCKHCGLSFIDVRPMTPVEITAEEMRLEKEAAQRKAAATERANIERLEAERQEREIAEIMQARRQAHKKAYIY